MDASPAPRLPVTACPVCGSRRFRYLFSVEHHRLVRCTDCRFTLLNPQPSDAELATIYGDSYFLGSDENAKASVYAKLKRRTAEVYLDLLASYADLQGGKLLEIGSGAGAMLLTAAKRGFQVTGVEYSEHACATARQLLETEACGGELVCGEIDAIAHRTGEFDVCIMADLIEHVRNPRRFVEIVHRVLRPGGVIFIATPSLDSWSARVMSTRWMEFKPEHLSYFNRRTLEGLLFSEGFRALAWEPGRKILSYDYICEHFEKFPVPVFSRAVQTIARLLPAAMRSRERSIVASGMIVMGQRQERPVRPRLSIIVPVYNEAATFREAFLRLLNHPFPHCDVEYVIVESNSTDGTRVLVHEFAHHPQVQVVWEDRPRGKGHAVRAGLQVARGDFIAIQDADLEYDLDDYDALLEPLLNNREAFVLGARHGGRAWKMRQFTGQPITSLTMNVGHWVFTTLINLCFLVSLKDPFTMYKIFRRDCLHGMPLECNRFDFDWELVIKLIRRGYVPVEIPVNYRSRSFGEGKKVTLFRDPITWLRALVRFRFVRLPRWGKADAVASSAVRAAPFR